MYIYINRYNILRSLHIPGTRDTCFRDECRIRRISDRIASAYHWNARIFYAAKFCPQLRAGHRGFTRVYIVRRQEQKKLASRKEKCKPRPRKSGSVPGKRYMLFILLKRDDM